MMIAGTIGFALFGESPWFEVCALAFGIGVGLTIDEFALWVHLDDVYWAEEGRRSIDATVVAALVMALLVFGLRPFEIESGSVGVLIVSLVVVLINCTVAGICFMKDRVLHGIVGLFIFPIGLYGAMRLGKPNSAWARRRYGDRNPGRQAAAVKRFPPDRRTQRFKERFRDVVGGGISQN